MRCDFENIVQKGGIRVREAFLHARRPPYITTTGSVRIALIQSAPVHQVRDRRRTKHDRVGALLETNRVSFILDTRLPHRSERTSNGQETIRDIAKGKVKESSAGACNRWRRLGSGVEREHVGVGRTQKERKREGKQARDDGAYLQLELAFADDPAVPLLRFPPRRGPFTQAMNHLHGFVCRSSKSLAGQFPFLCRVIPSRRV